MSRNLIIAVALVSGMVLAFEAQAESNATAAKAAVQQPHCRIVSYWGTPVFGRVCS